MNKKLKILIALLFISVFIYGGIHILHEKEMYELSKELEKAGEVYYQKKEYKKAKLFFDRALKRYNQLIVFKVLKKSEIEKLENRIKTDPNLQKVAQGYIYYNGKWVNEKQLEQLLMEKRRLKQKIDTYLKTAKFFGSIEDIENNITIYQNAVREIDRSPFAKDKEMKNLKNKLISKIVFLSEEAAKKYHKSGDLDKAAYYYETVLKHRDDPNIKKELFDIYLQIYNEKLEDGNYIKALLAAVKAKKLNVDNSKVLPKIDFVLSKIDLEEINKNKINDPYVFYVLAKNAYSRFDIFEAKKLAENSLKLDGNNTHALLLYAKILFDLGEIEKSREIINRLLKKAPQNAQALTIAGDISFREGEPEKALSFYQKVKDKNSVKDRLFRVYKKLGEKYLSSGDREKAKNFFEKAISIKDDPHIYKLLGDINFDLKNYKKAEKYYLNALKINPKLKKEINKKLATIYLTEGKNLYQKGRYRSAISYLKKAENFYKTSPEVLELLANSYEKTGDLKKALSYYKKVSKKTANKKEVQILVRLGDENFKKGNYFSAVNFYKRALNKDRSLKNKLKPKIVNSYIKIGDRYLAQKNYKKALEFYSRAVAIDGEIKKQIKDKLFISYLSIGKKYFKEGMYKSAYSYIAKAEKINPENPDVLRILGEIYLKESNLKKAKTYFEKLVKKSYSDAEILSKLAIINAKLGNLKDAKTYADQLIENPKYKGVANFVIGAYYYFYEKNPDKALIHLLRAEKSGYRNGLLYYYIGNIYYDSQKYLRAITYFTKAIENGLKNENVYMKRALSYLNLKDYRKAINDLTNVIKYNPENAQAYFLRGKLYYEHGNYVKGEYKKAIEDLEKAASMGIKEALSLLDKAKKR